MPQTITKTVYQFDELSDAAKERARDWYREASAQDEYWDSVYQDAETIGGMMGIEFYRRNFRTVGGKIGDEPCIWFSGFSSQGDGACFEGRYRYAKGGAAKVWTYAPTDEKLHAIAAGLQAIQRANGYRLSATVVHSGSYYHSGCTDIDVMKNGDDFASDEAIGEVTRLLRAFMDWIYSQLEAEYEYINSDEQVDESIRANEYAFEEDGTRSRDA